MLTREALREICLALKGATEDFPFGVDVAVFKVVGKMFALLPVDEPASISLKCDPNLAIVLRETYPQVTPGYHLNKQHWNSVLIEGMPSDEVREMIEHSYQLVVRGLTKAQRAQLASS